MKRWAPVFALVAGAAVLGVVMSRGCTQQLEPIRGRADVVEAGADPELAAAVLRARAELPRFRAALAEPGTNERDFAINARFMTTKGPEQLWVKVDRFEKGTYHGRLDAEPYALLGKHKGDAVAVPENDVVDWLFRVGDKVAGGYTMQVLLKRNSPPPR